MSDSIGPTLDQRRARHAWDAVERMAPRPGKDQKAYRREAKRLPVRILTAGLGHALAFLNAKRKPRDANDELLLDLADWVINGRHQSESATERPEAEALIKQVIEEDGAFLQVTTDEVLAYMQWLTRFAEAELEDDEA